MDAEASAPEVFKFGGEYGVLNGGVGVAAAGDRRATASVLDSASPSILYISLPDLVEKKGFVAQALSRDELKSVYDSMIKNKVMEPSPPGPEGPERIKKFKEENAHLNGDVLPFIAIGAWLHFEHGVDVLGREATLRSKIPQGSGCASSAALAVALTVAFLKSDGKVRLEDGQVIHAARAAERINHDSTNAGLMDASASFHGGVISCAKGVAKPIPCNLPEDVSIVLANTGPKSGTGEFVAKVQTAMNDEEVGHDIRHTLSTIGALASNIVLALADGDAVRLGNEMTATHKELKELGLLVGVDIATAKLSEVVKIAGDADALGSKLTGSGGGANAVSITKSPKTLIAALENHGFKDNRVVTISPQGAKSFLQERSRVPS